MIINVNIFIIYESLLQSVMKMLLKMYQIKLNFWEKVAGFRFNYVSRGKLY